LGSAVSCSGDEIKMLRCCVECLAGARIQRPSGSKGGPA
jgi:hypothetical protein